MKQISPMFLAGWICAASVCGASDAPALSLNHSSIGPGRTLRVTVKAEDNRPSTLTWGDRSTPFFQSVDKVWRVLIPVPLSLKPGKETLYVTVEKMFSKDMVEGPLEIEVLPSTYGKEDLVFSKEKSKLLNNPDEETESQFIREMLKASRNDPEQRWRGIFQLPVRGKVLSPYGRARNKVGRKTEDVHKGVDLASLAGTPVRAPNGGLVLLVKEFNFHGKTVLISHGQGVATIYLHMRSFNVKEGDKVEKGQKIGEVGATGLVTGPHLHWGLYVQAEPVDPIQWTQEEF